MSELPPIPIPLGQRWRWFRSNGLPAIVFLAAVASIAFLWERKVAPPSLAGEVYGFQSSVHAPRSGIIETFSLIPFQDVEAGEIIGVVRSIPAEQAEAMVATLRAEIELVRLGGADPVLNQQRNLLDWQGLRRDWLLARTELAGMRARLTQAELAYLRAKGLHENGAGAEADVELAAAEYHALVAEEAETTQLVAKLEEAVEASAPREGSDGDELGNAVSAALLWKEKQLAQLELEVRPLPIVMPFDGKVMLIHRRQGDFVREGDPIFELRSRKPEFIVGYVRQPSAIVPTEGMKVQVAMRSRRPAVAESTILQVGSQFEALGPAFQRPLALTEERALALLIRFPEELPLRPGEIVDLRLIE